VIFLERTFEKKFSKHDRKLQQKIYQAIQNIPNSDIRKLTGNNIPPIYRLRVSKYRIRGYKVSLVTKLELRDERIDTYPIELRRA